MKVYTYELIGEEIKTVNRKCKIYINQINTLYERLYDIVLLYRINNALDRFEFLTEYVIIYMTAIMCFDALVQEEVIDAVDKLNFMNFFQECYNFVPKR
ncbi:MAG: hypothetical protein HDT39_13710 [Lachnospiraceae bacterium]|nr:hypothetical protein [Lachnospiraceae bacterium]